MKKLIAILIILRFFIEPCFAQGVTDKVLALPESNQIELLAQKTLVISNSMFLMNLSNVDNNNMMFDIRNISYTAEKARNLFKEAVDSLNYTTTAIAKLKSIKYDSDSILNSINKLAIDQMTDSVKAKRDSLEKHISALKVNLEKQSADSIRLNSSIENALKIDSVKIHYLLLPRLNASVMSSFAFSAVKDILGDTSTKLDPVQSYVSQSVGELILESQTKLLEDSAESAGDLCVNRLVPIYFTKGGNSGKTRMNSFTKRSMIERKLKLHPDKFAGKDSTGSKLILQLVKRNYTGKMNLTNAESISSDAAILRSFLLSSNISAIMQSSILDDEGKKILTQYILDPNNVIKRKKNSPGSKAVVRNINKLIQLQGLTTGIDSLVVDYIQIEIRESSLHNLVVKGHLKSQPNSLIVFDNRNIPYALSSQIFLKNYRRYVPLQSRIINNPNPSLTQNISTYDMNLWNVIQYFPKFMPGGDNLAPAEGVEELDLTKSQGNCISLKRTKTSKLFEVKVFNDPLGFESDVPNGLVQFEVTKRFTTYPRSTKINGFTFIEPKFVWSKIEDKANLSLVRVNNSGQTSVPISEIDLVRYSKLQLDLRVNGATVASPASSMIIYLNAGGGIYQTKIEDSLYTYIYETDSAGTDSTLQISSVKSENINTLNYYIDLEFKFTPDNRYSLTINNRFGRFMPLDEKLTSVGITNISKQIFNYFSTSLEGSATVNKTRYFLRGAYTANLQDAKNNFFQLQIGVAKMLFKVKGE